MVGIIVSPSEVFGWDDFAGALPLASSQPVRRFQAGRQAAAPAVDLELSPARPDEQLLWDVLGDWDL